MASKTFQTELIRKLVDARLALRAEIIRQVLRKANFNPALRYVNETIQANLETVEAVKAGLLGVYKGVLITRYYGRPTGAEWYRDSAYSKPRWRTTYSVGVIVRYDPRLPQGFLVVTAYPRNEDWEAKFMRQYVAKSPGFRAFTRAMIQDYWMFDSKAELIDFGISHVLHQFPETADDLESFLDRWLKPDVTDQQLEDLWTASSADFFLLGDSVRPFLTQVLQRLRERRGQNSAS